MPENPEKLGKCSGHAPKPHEERRRCIDWQPIVPALPSDEEAEPPADDDVYGSDDPIKSLRGAWKAYLAADGPLDPNDPQKGVRTTAELRYATRWGMQPLLDRLDAAEAHVSRLEAVVEAARAFDDGQRHAELVEEPTEPDLEADEHYCPACGEDWPCSTSTLQGALATLDASLVVPDADGGQT